MKKLIFGIFALLLVANANPLDVIKNGAKKEASKFIANSQIDSFEKAKQVLPSIFDFHNRTIYCDCPYKVNGKNIELQDCPNYSPRNVYTKNGKLNERTKRVEWEHIVPAENFGRQFKEWREGHPKCVDSKGKAFKGRNCAKKVNYKFRMMEADLRNLLPAIGEINADRKNFRFAENRDDLADGAYGKCRFRADFNEKKAFVRDEIKGLIARTYLYFVDEYQIDISKQDLTLYKHWDKKYPPTPFEVEWLRRVEIVKKNFQQREVIEKTHTKDEK